MSSIVANPVFAVIFFIGILIFVHELGHFLVGKALGLGVEIFSIGFGPELLAFNHRGTRYRLAIIPLGGYVKFAGMLPREEVPPHFVGREMHRASRWVRAATLFAGPFANLLLAVAVYTGLGLQGVPHHPAIIGQVMPTSPAARAGIFPEDKIISLAGNPLTSWEDLRDGLAKNPGTPLPLELEREGHILSLTLTPEVHEGTDQLGRKAAQGRAGIAFGVVPAVITLSDTRGAAAKAGLKTGEKITSLRLSLRASDPSKVRAIHSWHELQKTLYWAFSLGATKITLGVESAATRELTLATTAWPTLTLDESTPLPEFSQELGDSLAEKLGFTSSTLTIAQAGEKLGGKVQAGDRILAINSEAIHSVYELSEKLSANTKAEIILTVQRNFQPLTLPLSLEPLDRQEMGGKTTYYSLDVTLWGQALLPAPVLEKYDSFGAALFYGVRTTVKQSVMLIKAIGFLLIGQLPLQSLGGPIMIAKVAQDAIELGWQVFFTTLALMSINLGLMNLFPIPVADGGQLVLVALEALKGKPLSEKAMENFQRLGFVMLMALIILATYNDLSRFWAGMLKGVVELFH